MSTPTLLWLRLDLRLADHPALCAAIARGGPVIPIFLWSPHEEGEWAPGAASNWWLHRSLQVLQASLERAGSRLVIRRVPVGGSSLEALQTLLRETGATAVYWSRRYEPLVTARDRIIKETLRASGLEARSFNAALLAEPWDIENLSGKPFQVFTPFWRKLRASIDPPAPLAAPKRIPAPNGWPVSETLDALGLQPRIPWDTGFSAVWTPGERGASDQLEQFLDTAVASYGEQRNLPGIRGTSRLSAHLHFGEISARQVWHVAAQWRDSQFMTEIGWREFAHHLLHHFPHTTNAPLRSEFARFPWREDAAGLQAWHRARTGIPLVDAGMRELWETGWMHNRVRMVVASFLVKNLRIHWLEGARWFWDTLVDADLASNTLGWQWTAGCGADAAPYFRVFNPVGQAEKFDAEGHYLQRWVPERDDPTRYPAPIVDLKTSREDALAAWEKIRR